MKVKYWACAAPLFRHERPIARSLDLIGEWWTLLIVREAFWGTRRFGEFQTHLGIAPNVLTSA